jgi:hypothetical protein
MTRTRFFNNRRTNVLAYLEFFNVNFRVDLSKNEKSFISVEDFYAIFISYIGCLDPLSDSYKELYCDLIWFQKSQMGSLNAFCEKMNKINRRFLVKTSQFTYKRFSLPFLNYKKGFYNFCLRENSPYIFENGNVSTSAILFKDSIAKPSFLIENKEIGYIEVNKGNVFRITNGKTEIFLPASYLNDASYYSANCFNEEATNQFKTFLNRNFAYGPGLPLPVNYFLDSLKKYNEIEQNKELAAFIQIGEDDIFKFLFILQDFIRTNFACCIDWINMTRSPIRKKPYMNHAIRGLVETTGYETINDFHYFEKYKR